jgi:hypothetical protein
MDRISLRILLDTEGVDPESYSLDGGMPFESYVLEPRGSEWVVFYSERGLRAGEEVFGTEDEACGRLLDSILRDPTTRRPE